MNLGTRMTDCWSDNRTINAIHAPYNKTWAESINYPFGNSSYLIFYSCVLRYSWEMFYYLDANGQDPSKCCLMVYLSLLNPSSQVLSELRFPLEDWTEIDSVLNQTDAIPRCLGCQCHQAQYLYSHLLRKWRFTRASSWIRKYVQRYLFRHPPTNLALVLKLSFKWARMPFKFILCYMRLTQCLLEYNLWRRSRFQSQTVDSLDRRCRQLRWNSSSGKELDLRPRKRSWSSRSILPASCSTLLSPNRSSHSSWSVLFRLTH